MTTGTINTDIENCLRELLKNEGYSLKSKKGLAMLGPDIKAAKGGKAIYIEIADLEDLPLERSSRFCQVFFQAVSRLNNKDCSKIVIAVPEKSKKLLSVKARIYKVAWERISKTFPELEVWLVNTEKNSYRKTAWDSWLSGKK